MLKMILKFKIYSNQNLLVDVLSGNISLKQLYKLHESYLNDKNIGCVHKVLTNVCAANFEFGLTEMYQYIEEIKRKAMSSNLKWAIITDLPNSTMFSMLIKEDLFFKNKVQVFSTLPASTKYLGINFNAENFNDSDFTIIN